MRLHKPCTLETQTSAFISLFIPLTNLNIPFFNNAAPPNQPFQADFYCPHPSCRSLVTTGKQKGQKNNKKRHKTPKQINKKHKKTQGLSVSEVKRKIGKQKWETRKTWFKFLYIIAKICLCSQSLKIKAWLLVPFADCYMLYLNLHLLQTQNQDGLNFFFKWPHKLFLHFFHFLPALCSHAIHCHMHPYFLIYQMKCSDFRVI